MKENASDDRRRRKTARKTAAGKSSDPIPTDCSGKNRTADLIPPDSTAKNRTADLISADRFAKKRIADPASFQKEAVFEQAKLLIAKDTIDSLTHAAELLSSVPGSRAEQYAEKCLHRVMVLEARARARRHQILKVSLILTVALGFSAYILFGIVRPSMNYRTGPSFHETQGQSGGPVQTVKNSSGEENDMEKTGGNKSAVRGTEYNTLVGMSDTEVTDYSEDTVPAAQHSELPGDWTPPVSSGQNSTLLGIVTGEGGMRGGDGLNESGSSSGKVSDGASDASSQLQADSVSAMSAEKGGLESSSSGSGTFGEESSGGMGSGSLVSAASLAESENVAPETGAGTRKSDAVRQGPGAYLTAAGILLAIFAAVKLRKLIRSELQYRKAVEMIQSGQYTDAITLLKSLEGYRDSTVRITGCKTAIKDDHYTEAVKLKDSGRLEDAIDAFHELDGYKDSSDQIEGCRQSLQDRDYEAAAELLKADEYEKAEAAFTALDGYRDSRRMAEKCRKLAMTQPVYDQAVSCADAGSLKDAEALFAGIPGFRDANARLLAIRQTFYDDAAALMECGDYAGAAEAFDSLGTFADSGAMAQKCRRALLDRDFKAALAMRTEGRYEDAIDALRALSEHPDAKALIEECRRQVRVPRPFTGLDHGMSPEKVVSVLGEPAEKKNPADGKTEYLYRGRAYMNCSGHIVVSFAEDAVESLGWTADFADGAAGTPNSDRLYNSIIKYYVSLFGKQASDRTSPGHKVVWWFNPAITVDYSKDRYIHIMY